MTLAHTNETLTIIKEEMKLAARCMAIAHKAAKEYRADCNWIRADIETTQMQMFWAKVSALGRVYRQMTRDNNREMEKMAAYFGQ